MGNIRGFDVDLARAIAPRAVTLMTGPILHMSDDKMYLAVSRKLPALGKEYVRNKFLIKYLHGYFGDRRFALYYVDDVIIRYAELD
jgi:hypothetical protein